MGTVAAKRHWRWPAGWAGLAILAALAAGCGHHEKTQPPAQATAPAYPTYPSEAPTVRPAMPSSSAGSGPIPVTAVPPGGVTDEDKDFILSHRPFYSEEGDATWYTAPYKGRKAANGQVFDDDALTAAHRTLPMGSLIVVTNLSTRQQSAMRISDRGPFAPGKIIDLTIASAKSIGLYRVGTTRVRIDVYQTPKPMETGGRWCVQIGAFTSERRALKLKEELLRDYPEAKVIEFAGEASWWVRIRPEGDDREEAEAIARRVHPDEGDAYLTRLD